jgi:transglutaminase-like putative cysteine protease
MQYTIHHSTKFAYETAVSESVMEVRMQPRSEGPQRCIHFGLSTTPASRVRMYQDHDGNIVHHFNIPGRHPRLTVTAEALVESSPLPPLPALEPGAWHRLDARTNSGEFWELMNPSLFACHTPALEQLARDIGLERGPDPLEMLWRLTNEIYDRFEYSPQTTNVDSPIDHALEQRQGVCQDFSHIMIALVRRLGVPCRYVSGYLFQQADSSVRSSSAATHAWVEAWLPDLGWVGFDPTNNLAATDGHIRVAVGRDYADVPPTRGIFKGTSAVRGELAVAVRVGPARGGAVDNTVPFVPWMSLEAAAPLAAGHSTQQQQQ